MRWLAKYFFRGLLTLLPVAVTVYIVYLVFTELNELIFLRVGRKIETLIHEHPRSEELFSWVSFSSTSVGFLTTVALITVVGFFASNFLGGTLVRFTEGMFQKLPLVKLLHKSIKDLLAAFVGDKKGFEKPVVASLTPDGSTKVLGFVTRESLEFLDLHDHVAVYLPQSYNFAGNLLLVPSRQVTPISTESSDVMAFLVSGGVSASEEA